MRSLIALLGLLVVAPAHAAALIRFWNVPEHGGNSFSGKPPSLAYFKALRGYGRPGYG
jgi:hypothetical protein